MTMHFAICCKNAVIAKYIEFFSYLQVISYPVYDQDGYDGDLALLRLEHPVPFSRNIRPVCLPLNSKDTYEKQVELTINMNSRDTYEKKLELTIIETAETPTRDR
jgi:hypothetical protein